jgi:hypothetical protein
MFQYALYRTIRHFREDVVFEIDDYGEANPRQMELQDAFGVTFRRFRFPPVTRIVTVSGKLLEDHGHGRRIVAGVGRRVAKAAGRMRSKFLSSFSAVTDREFVQIEPTKLARRVRFDGYWQSSEYFSNIENELRQAFVFRASTDQETERLLRSIVGHESVSIHFRRGDYVSDPLFRQIYGDICTEDYYERAVEYVRGRVADPHFFVFSDDRDWAMRSPVTQKLGSCEIASLPDSLPWVDMFLMSQCTHNIIANSSYSWWASWLNGHHEKIVVAPSRWINAGAPRDLNDLSHIGESYWTRIDA